MSGATRGLCDLFDRPEVGRFIEEVADVDHLTIVAGAGTSIESGFPDWTALVSGLLRAAAERAGLSDDAAGEFTRWTLRREGLAGAAAVASASLDTDFHTVVHRVLYEQQLTPPPGQTALGIARVAASRGLSNCDLSTTNYDLLLEAALGTVLERAVSTATKVGRTSLDRVLHLHGVVRPRGGIAGDLILSDRDYARMQQDSAWQQEHFAERLTTSMCLFVGASLTDPNLLRYLYRVPSDRTHYAIFVRQQDAGVYDEAAREVIELRETSSEARWQEAGVIPLQADFFSQSAQLLHEVVHRRETARRRRVYKPLPRRLSTWRNKVDAGVLSISRTGFADRQDGLRDFMSEILDGVQLDLADAGHRRRKTERLGVSMWVYDPASETLTNWASADRSWRDPTTLEPLDVDWRSDFVSVQAFCAGSLVSRSTERYAVSRWNHVIGFPIYVDTERRGRLPVGAVTLASTAPSPESALHRGLGTLRRVSLPTVEEALADLLDPDVVSGAG